MPTIFKGVCNDCGYETPVMPAGYSAVFVDTPVAEPQSLVAGAAFTSAERGEIGSVEDPRFVVLAHPLEQFHLQSTGYTWRDLFRQGRYVLVTNTICLDCGTLFPRRRLAVPGITGCLPSLVSGIGIALAVGAWRGSVLAGFVAWYAGTIGAVLVVKGLALLHLRLRFSKRWGALAVERSCPTCHADHSRGIEHAKSVRCPACRHNALRFISVGMS